MATAPKPALTLNGKDITEVEAIAHLTKIYGDRRAPEIIKGLADGTHKCASVEQGYIELKRVEIKPE